MKLVSARESKRKRDRERKRETDRQIERLVECCELSDMEEATKNVSLITYTFSGI